MSEPRILPRNLIEAVDFYVECELADAARYDNRQPLDESGIWSLHALAARIYAAGWADGESAEGERGRAARSRERERLATRLSGGLAAAGDKQPHQKSEPAEQADSTTTSKEGAL